MAAGKPAACERIQVPGEEKFGAAKQDENCLWQLTEGGNFEGRSLKEAWSVKCNHAKSVSVVYTV